MKGCLEAWWDLRSCLLVSCRSYLLGSPAPDRRGRAASWGDSGCRVLWAPCRPACRCTVTVTVTSVTSTDSHTAAAAPVCRARCRTLLIYTAPPRRHVPAGQSPSASVLQPRGLFPSIASRQCVARHVRDSFRSSHGTPRVNSLFKRRMSRRTWPLSFKYLRFYPLGHNVGDTTDQHGKI